jgi:alpha-tubulin suppressor-like RCC1 family protein
VKTLQRALLLGLLAAVVLPACGSGSGGGGAPSAVAEDLAFPAIDITGPTTEAVFEVNASPVDIAGTASDAVGLQSVTWSNAATGATGAANGLENWTSSVWLVPGPNPITFTAADTSGNIARDSVTVILRAFSLRGWGRNDRGQIGDGTLFSRNRPVTLPYLQGVKQIAAGLNHTVALLTDGSLRAWGDSSVSQVGGLAPAASNPVPVQLNDSDPVLDLKNIVQVACGDHFTVALDASGIAWFWGGFDFPWDDPVPAVSAVTTAFAWSSNWFGISNIKEVAAGSNHIMFLLSDGTLRVTGRNHHGQFGDNTSSNFTDYGSFPSTVTLAGGVRARAIFAGGDSCAYIGDNGALYTWGRNHNGQLGLGDKVGRLVPTQVGANTDWNQVSLSITHALGIRSGNVAQVWGSNGNGQLGTNDLNERLTPATPVAGFGAIRAVAVAAGVEGSVILDEGGTVRTSGINLLGTLGTGSASANSIVFQTVTGLNGIAQIDIGEQHVVALKGDNPVVGFGLDFTGQLGTGRVNSTPVATSPVGISTAVQVIAGSTQTLVRLADGSALGFGFNFQGEVGDGTFNAVATPVPVLLPPAPAIATMDAGQSMAADAGQSMAAAILADGSVWTWGSNGSGQLGDGSNTTRPTPSQISAVGMTPATAISVGQNHMLAVGPGGSVWAWGNNLYGQLGIPSPPNSSNLPLAVPGISGAVAVSAGETHSLALLSNGTVLAWGRNFSGQLGDGTTTDRATPQPVPGLTGVVAVSAGTRHSIALLSNGTVRAWGDNGSGQLGNGGLVDSPVPVQVGFLTGVTAVAAGGNHTLALLGDQTLAAWGENLFGQIGDSTTTNALFPTGVLFVRRVVGISAGLLHSAAVLADGSVRTWGGNIYGNLGDGSRVVITRPVAAVGFPAVSGVNSSGASLIGAGGDHSFAVLALGKYRAWGLNDEGQLGDGTFVDKALATVPAGPAGSLQIRQAALGRDHAVIIEGSGSILTAGGNQYAQLGRSTAPASNSNIFGSTAVGGMLKVFAGQDASYALHASGIVYSWGSDHRGEAGNGGAAAHSVPTALAAFAAPDRIVELATGGEHTLALDSRGRIWGWGSNWDRQLLDSATVSYDSPTLISGAGPLAGRTYRGIACGRDHSLALDMNGNVWTWGRNDAGQLGRGTTNTVAPFYLTPAQVVFSGTTGNLKAIEVKGGEDFSAVLLADGSVWTTGINSVGQLGTGDTLSLNEFTRVPGVSGVVSVSAGRQHTLLRK